MQYRCMRMIRLVQSALARWNIEAGSLDSITQYQPCKFVFSHPYEPSWLVVFIAILYNWTLSRHFNFIHDNYLKLGDKPELEF
ncbi:hypothetical protein TWF594_001922 [Orbilia oligospora]|nr:hypothetical protein TWF103_003543 [Orbilia oligospora]KAF3147993.1 hypothetical protein TWF594_001922 [Orbilia oligospora]